MRFKVELERDIRSTILVFRHLSPRQEERSGRRRCHLTAAQGQHQQRMPHQSGREEYQSGREESVWPGRRFLATGNHVIQYCQFMVGMSATKPSTPLSVSALGEGDQAPRGMKSNTRQSNILVGVDPGRGQGELFNLGWPSL